MTPTRWVPLVSITAIALAIGWVTVDIVDGTVEIEVATDAVVRLTKHATCPHINVSLIDQVVRV